VAAELGAQGIPVRAHVVGFGLTDGEVQQIACVAEMTGGQVLLAQSGDDLAKALTTVDLPPAVVALSLRPVDAATGAVLGAVDWVLSNADGREQHRAAAQGTWAIEVTPGAYQVVATAPGYAGGLSLDITAQSDGVIDVPMEPTHARLALIARDEETGRELPKVTWMLTGANGAEITFDSGSGSVLVPPGTYRITGRSGDRVGTAELSVALGEQSIEVVFPAPLHEATLDAGAEAGAGATIPVDWTGPDDRQDFITAVPAGAPDTEEGNLARTYKGSPVALKLPDATGAFELRYVHAATGTVLARRAITLTEPAASVTAPETAVAGARIAVEWQGPDNQNDFVTVVAAGAPDSVEGNLARTYRGSPAELLLPDALGAHELRYVFAQSGRVLARRPITLTEPVASLRDPGPILPGGRFKVTWEGPDNQNDFITIVPQGAPEDEKGSLARTYRGSPAELKAPGVSGAYELRYVMAQSGRVLAILPVKVGAGTVSLAIEGTAQVGQPLRVAWSGPGRYEDAIEIVPAGSATDAVAMRSTRASQGNPAVLQALPAPGTYQLRYRATDSGEVLHQIDIEVRE
jgi:Ca-activated chloride channel family protein